MIIHCLLCLTYHFFHHVSFQTSGPAETPQEEVSGGLLDSGSPTFLKALRYACVMLGVALFFSLIYECIRRIRSREKVQQKGEDLVSLLCTFKFVFSERGT